jgi:tetratricopeptide (TPR) repeat protein
MTLTIPCALLLTMPAAPLFASPEEVDTAADGHLRRAERLRATGRYVEAAVAYHLYLESAPAGARRQHASQRLFDIGNYWLEDTRADMEELEKNGKRRFRLDVHWDNSKPLWGEESWALWAMEQAYRGDPKGPSADKALFLIASVHFFRENYADADHYFGRLLTSHPSSPLIAMALKLAIMTKTLREDRPAEQRQRFADARRLIERYRREYPHLMQDPDTARFLANRLALVTIRQSELALQQADECRKAGCLASALWGYALTGLLYPGTRGAEEALKRLVELGEEPCAR